MDKVFTIVESFHGYYIYYNPVPALGGRCCGDGVDEPYGMIGSESFRLAWEEEANGNTAEFFDAYFPELADLIVFDCGDEFFDRYQVVLPNNKRYHQGQTLHLGLGLSHNPDSPQGFSQWGECNPKYMAERNTRISFMDLPANVQQHAVERLENCL